MKKIVLGCLLFVGMISGLYADTAENVQFKQYVEMNKKSPTNPPGMTVCADETYRTIYVAMPLPIPYSNLKPEMVGEMKKAMLKALAKQSNDIKVVKSLKINFVFSYITTDKNIITVPISHNDF